MQQGGFLVNMNKQMAQYIQGNLTEIISRWQEKMKNEEQELSFRIMPEKLINQTSHEFAELMISNLLESHQAYESRINDFAEKVVRQKQLGTLLKLFMKI